MPATTIAANHKPASASTVVWYSLRRRIGADVIPGPLYYFPAVGRRGVQSLNIDQLSGRRPEHHQPHLRDTRVDIPMRSKGDPEHAILKV